MPDHTGAKRTPFADDIAGRPIILVFDAGRSRNGFRRTLRRFADAADELTRYEATVFVISGLSVASLAALREEERLPFAVHSDAHGDIVRGGGARGDVGRLHGIAGHAGDGAAVSFVMDPNYRIQAILGGEAGEDHPAAVLRHLAAEAARRVEGVLGIHPPVLVLPRMLSTEQCCELVDIWHRPVRLWHTDGHTSPGFERDPGDFKVRNDFYGKVVQYVVRDVAIAGQLDACLGPRVGDAVRRAFQFAVTGREPYRIACYDAREGGSLPAHRDNPTAATQHRRFTLSINLDADGFSGGELRFREYGRQLYRTETGTAVIWSCDLLHEVMPVTGGRRFILGTHLMG